MKLIIDIDEKRINAIKLKAQEQDIKTPYPTLEQIIANGIPQEPPTGHWKKNVDDRRTWTRVRFICSECGQWQSYGETKFCPRCGAPMDVNRDEVMEHYKKLGEYYNGEDI